MPKVLVEGIDISLENLADDGGRVVSGLNIFMDVFNFGNEILGKAGFLDPENR